MVYNRKNERKIEFDLLNFIKKNKKYSKTQELQKTNNLFIQAILNKQVKPLWAIKGIQI